MGPRATAGQRSEGGLGRVRYSALTKQMLVSQPHPPPRRCLAGARSALAGPREDRRLILTRATRHSRARSPSQGLHIAGELGIHRLVHLTVEGARSAQLSGVTPVEHHDSPDEADNKHGLHDERRQGQREGGAVAIAIAVVTVVVALITVGLFARGCRSRRPACCGPPEWSQAQPQDDSPQSAQQTKPSNTMLMRCRKQVREVAMKNAIRMNVSLAAQVSRCDCSSVLRVRQIGRDDGARHVRRLALVEAVKRSPAKQHRTGLTPSPSPTKPADRHTTGLSQQPLTPRWCFRTRTGRQCRCSAACNG
eukprot:scaffold2090_cov225-Prasinococcus_capsulatus_cf.AAC.8